jgi:aryl-alcohol dehydrogenase-like predicted oxidoreductase
VAELRDAGKVRLVGVSNVDIDQLEEASTIVPIASVQNQFSPAFRSSVDELAWCASRGIAFLPWSPLGGMSGAAGLADCFPAFADVAANHGVSPQQVALAWELAQADVVIPIPGASRPATIVDSAAAVDLELSVDELATLSMDLGC